MIIRPVRSTDIDTMVELSGKVAGGMTSLPTDRQAWQDKLALVESSFVTANADEHGTEHGTKDEALYFLVLENPVGHDIAGCAAIHVGVGLKRPFYTYRLSRHVKTSALLGITTQCSTLNLVNDFTGNAELVSLFVNSEYRGCGFGQVLSYARFLFMYDFPSRVQGRIFAEIRGQLDSRGDSPFWNCLGKKFFNVSYQQADTLCAVHGTQFVSDLMPKHPIYVELLPQAAAAVLAKPHQDSAAAMAFLMELGFRYNNALDIFDAGPVVECEREHIRIFDRCETYTALITEDDTSREARACDYLISNRRLSNYRMVKRSMRIGSTEQINIDRVTARELEVNSGDLVSVMLLKERAR